MKLSTRAKYGIHAMIDLAYHEGRGPQAINAIAERQGMPEQYLEQLIALLRRRGLVRSVRGAQGGYLLARPAKDITMQELMDTLEGPIRFSDCVYDQEHCANSGACATQKMWVRLNARIAEELRGTTLADVLGEQLRLEAEKGQPQGVQGGENQ